MGSLSWYLIYKGLEVLKYSSLSHERDLLLEGEPTSASIFFAFIRPSIPVRHQIIFSREFL